MQTPRCARRTGDDKELLELAAKAAGIPEAKQDWLPGFYRSDAFDTFGRPVEWNPLRDSSSALDLAVSLRLKVFCRTNSVEVCSEDGNVRITEPHYHNPYAATRRAIVRAAAEIGKDK